MSDFWTEDDGPVLWIDYFGEYGHLNPQCGGIGKTRRQCSTDRDMCPECGGS